MLFGVFVTTPTDAKSDVAAIIDGVQFLGLKLMLHTTDKKQNPVGGK